MCVCVHSKATSPLHAVKTSCRHFTEALQLAAQQRFAHEYGDATVAEDPTAARQTDTYSAETEFVGEAPPFTPDGAQIRCSDPTADATSAADGCTQDSAGPEAQLTGGEADCGDAPSSAGSSSCLSSSPDVAPESNHQGLDLPK